MTEQTPDAPGGERAKDEPMIEGVPLLVCLEHAARSEWLKDEAPWFHRLIEASRDFLAASPRPAEPPQCLLDPEVCGCRNCRPDGPEPPKAEQEPTWEDAYEVTHVDGVPVKKSQPKADTETLEARIEQALNGGPAAYFSNSDMSLVDRALLGDALTELRRLRASPDLRDRRTEVMPQCAKHPNVPAVKRIGITRVWACVSCVRKFLTGETRWLRR